MTSHQRESGFTMIELVMVLVITGILAAIALPRFFDKSIEERGFHDAVKAALQHARREAMASRRYVCVTVTAGTGAAATVAVDRDPITLPGGAANCTTPQTLPSPGRGCAANNQVCAPSGVTLGGSTLIIFDAQGRSVTTAGAVQAGALNVTVSNQPGITVQADTGYVQ